MSIKTFKLHESEASDKAKKMGLVHFGRGVYGKKKGDKPSFKASDDGKRLEPIDKAEPKSDTKPDKAQPSKKSSSPSNSPARGKLADRDDKFSDGAIKQKGLDIGYNEVDGFKPAPGNAGSMMQEIMTGEASNIITLKPDITEDELQRALYNQVKDTTLGKQNSGGETFKRGDREGLDKKLFALMGSTAKSGMQKHKKMTKAIDALAEDGKVIPPAKIRNFYGHSQSIDAQVELIKASAGPFYTNKGVEIPRDQLVEFIRVSGGGENPSDTSSIAIDSKGRGVVTFHSDKISTADIQANSTPNKESDQMKDVVSGLKIKEETKAKAIAIIEEGQKSLIAAEAALKDVGVPLGQGLQKIDLGSAIEKIKSDPLVASRFVGGKKSIFTGTKTKNRFSIEDGASEEEQLKSFIDYMADPNKTKEPSSDMIKLIQRVGAQNDVKVDLGKIKQRSLDVQRETNDKLNETQIKLPNGKSKGLGDYLEGKNIIDKLHLGVVDGEKGEGVGKYPGLFNLNMGGTVVEAEQIKAALNIESTDDFITHFDVGKPGDGEEVTKNAKTGAITGRNIFVYAITKEGKRIPIAMKTQRSKQGVTGKLSTTYQWHPEVQKKFKDLNVVEQSTFKEHTQSLEEIELAELFGSIPFTIDTLAWQSKHSGQRPKGNDTWKFDFKVPVRSAGSLYLDDGDFTFKGMFKKAVKALVKYLKTSAGPKGNLKQAKVVLKP